MKKPTQIIGYQRTKEDKDLILQYCKNKDLPKPKIIPELRTSRIRWHESQLRPYIEKLQAADHIIFNAITMTGKSIEDVLLLLKVLSSKKVSIHIIEKDLVITENTSPADLFDLLSDAVSQLRHLLSKNGVQRRREKGKTIGRPVGTGYSKLDPHKEEIASMLKAGSKQKVIALYFGVNEATMSNFVRKHNLKK